MSSDHSYLPDSVYRHFASSGYLYQGEENPYFGGIVFYLQRGNGEQEAAYYISKPSAIELVTSDELRRVLDLLEGSGIRLRHLVTTSPLSYATRELVGENEIKHWELQSRCVEIARPIDADVRVRHQTLRAWLRGIVL